MFLALVGCRGGYVAIIPRLSIDLYTSLHIPISCHSAILEEFEIFKMAAINIEKDNIQLFIINKLRKSLLSSSKGH